MRMNRSQRAVRVAEGCNDPWCVARSRSVSAEAEAKA